MSSRWQSNKIGLVNFWYYNDEQVFYFANGRMLLRGSNGSGKSVTMQSVVPLLLDGNMSPERLDPFGSRDRKMSSYLLEDDDDREERTGYLYLEFKRLNSEAYMTIGMGIRARRGKPLDKWYFVISDGRRIGRDFYLYKSVGEKITLSRRELENRIAEGGRVFDKQAEYMEYVNSHIFGFETKDEYKELIDLLIQLRTPKLSKDFKPSVINEILSDSLQPLSDDDLRPMSEAIENMDELSRKLKDEEAAIAAAEKINRAYDKYNRLMLYKKAAACRDVQEKLTQTNQQKAQKEKDLQSHQAQIRACEAAKQEMEVTKQAMEKERESLGKSDAAILKQRERELEKEAEHFTAAAKEKTQMLDTRKQRLQTLEYKVKDTEDERYRREKTLRQQLEEMDAEADCMAFDEHAFFRDELLEQLDESYDYAVHQKQFDTTKAKIAETFHILEETQQLKKESDVLDEKRDRMVRELDSAQRKQTEAETLLIQTESEWKEALYSWAEGNTELQLEASVLGRISRFADDYDENADFSQVRQIAADVKQSRRNALQSLHHESAALLAETEKSLSAVRKELEAWENRKEPEPERSEAVLKSRARLAELGIPYQEFYKTMEFSDMLDEAACDRLEEALLAMGILDALVIEESYRDKVMTFAEGCADRYLFAGSPQSGKSLLDILQLNDEVNDIFSNQRLTGILGSIAYDGDWQTAISTDGTYRIGVLSGTITGLHKAAFLGTKAREHTRLARIRACKEEIERLEAEMEHLQSACRQIEERMERLESEYQAFPQDADLKAAWRTLQDAEHLCSRMQDEKNRLEEELQIIKNKIRAKQEEAYESGKQLHLEFAFPVFRQATEAAESYDKLLVQLIAAHELHQKTVQAIRDLETQREEIEDDIMETRNELADAERNLLRKQTELDSVRSQLALTDYAQIKERLDACTAWLEAFPQRLEDNTEKATVCRQVCKILEQEIEDCAGQLVSLGEIEARLTRCYEKERKLAYVEIPEEIGVQARALAQYLKSDVEEFSWESVTQRLNEVYYQQRDFLNEYQPSLKTDLFAEEDEGQPENAVTAKRNDIRARYQGIEIPFPKLLAYLKTEITELKELIKAGDRELFEDILANTVSRKIRSKINAADRWVGNMNQLMSSMNTSSGLKLSLKWRSKTAETEEQLDTGELVQLLKKDYRTMSEEESGRLSLHFRSKVEEARRNSGDQAGLVSFYQVMKDTLDYRKWFEFQLFAQKTGERRKELTNSVFGTFSGGEKAMAMYVPLFSAVVAKYEGGSQNAPRLISLDEAFAGVDSRNIRDMFRLMSEFDFDFIINSQVLWGDCDTLDALAIYQLQRPENAKFVTVMSYLWNGSCREALEHESMVEEKRR